MLEQARVDYARFGSIRGTVQRNKDLILARAGVCFFHAASRHLVQMAESAHNRILIRKPMAEGQEVAEVGAQLPGLDSTSDESSQFIRMPLAT